MAVATGTAMLIGAGISAAAGAYGAHKASHTQEKASDQAIALAREQEAEKRREWEAQQKAAAYQWKTLQANLAPYRAARASILNKYGINTDVQEPTMPEGYGMPGFAAPPTNQRVAVQDIRGPGMASLSAMQQGGPEMQSFAPVGSAPPPMMAGQAINPGNLANWSDWNNYLNAGRG